MGERRACTALLKGASEGRGGCLVLAGSAGSGRTALARWAWDEAARFGFRVLSSDAVEAEAEIGFAALATICRPLLSLLSQLEEGQRSAVESAFASGMAEVRPLAAYSGVLGLLDLAASDTPIAIVVDDAHWWDPASLAALAFIARRLGEMPVALIATCGDMPAPLVNAGLPVVSIRRLDQDESVSVVIDAVPGLSHDVARRVAEVADGRPGLLVDLAKSLRPDERDATEPLHDRWHERLARRAAATRIDGLGEQARTVLALFACERHGIAATAALAAGGLGIEPSAWAEPEAEGLMTVTGGRVSWDRSTSLSAIHDELEPERRRRAHSALASVTTGEDAAWHRAGACAGVDAGAAEALMEVGQQGLRRGAPAAAARAFGRAAELSADPASRELAERAAGQALFVAGDLEGAVARLETALFLAPDPAARADIIAILGPAELWRTGPAKARQLLLAEAAAVGDLDPVRAAILACRAVPALVMGGRSSEGVRVLADAAARCTDADMRRIVRACALLPRAVSGEGRMVDADLDEMGRWAVEAVGAFAADLEELGQLVGGAALLRERFDIAHAVLRQVISSGRAAGTATTFAAMLDADASWREGRWAEAEAGLRAAIDLADDTTDRASVVFAPAMLVRVAAARGHREEALLLAEQVLGAVDKQGNLLVSGWARAGLGLLALGTGDPAGAADVLGRLVAELEDAGADEPGCLWVHGDLVEALAGAGRRDEAAEALRAFERLATNAPSRWAAGAVGRCQGVLLEGRHEAETALEAALAEQAELGNGFEIGRTLMVRGARRLSWGDAGAAADVDRAIAEFDIRRAVPWAERARALVRRDDVPRIQPLELLTEAERRVALAVMQGFTNRQTAAHLFVSPKTVDKHLQSIYRKLGVHTRLQLVRTIEAGNAIRSD